MPNTFFYIILVILVSDFILERVLDYLNSTYWSDKLPEELHGIYTPEQYTKSQRYHQHQHRFSQLTDSLTFVVVVAILSTGGFVWLDQTIRLVTDNPVWLGLLFFGIIGLISSLVSIPFEWYVVFVIEEKYGFNTMTIRTFISDTLKSWFLAVIIGGGLLAMFIWVYEATGNYFWVIVWLVTIVFLIFMTMFYANLIVPLFNRQRQLETGPLRDSIELFAGKVGFQLQNIFVMDGSKRSTKANAYFTGFGRKKRIVLYDTLIHDHSADELVAILAHEIGHYKKRHVIQGMAFTILSTGLMLFMLSFFIRKESVISQSLCQALSGFSGLNASSSFHLGILAFGILYSPLSLILGLVTHYISRRNEYAADRFAGTHFPPVFLKAALKKLSVNNLSNVRPHPACVFFYYSHPPLLQRLTALDTMDKPKENF